MHREIYRYEFDPTVATEDIESTLALALIGTESIHGETAALLDASHFFDPNKRACVIEAGGEVGRDFNSLFAGFLRREFGPEAFRVRRVESTELATATTAA